MTIIEKGYVCKKSRYSSYVNPVPGSIYFLVKPNTNGKKGHVDVSNVQFPNDMIGKWVRFKVELKDDEF